MAFGIVLLKQAQGGIELILHAHYSQFAFESVRRYTEVTAHEVLETDEDLEFLHRLLGIEVLVVVGSYSSNREVQSVPCHILVNRGYLKTESHEFLIESLVGFQELFHGLVYGFGNTSLEDVAHVLILQQDLFVQAQRLNLIPRKFPFLELIAVGELGDTPLVVEFVVGDLFGQGAVLIFAFADLDDGVEDMGEFFGTDPKETSAQVGRASVLVAKVLEKGS